MTKLTGKQRLEAENATLKRKLMETEAQLAHVFFFAQDGIKKADRKRTFASGVLVQLHYLGGKEVCLPFVLKDGLSDESIAALCADIVYSYDKTVEIKPKGNQS